MSISETRPARDIKALSSYLLGVQSTHYDFIRRLKKDEKGEPLFFHYSDLTGLKGIVTEHDLWLTHALFCNDEAELNFGITIAREEIAKLRKEKPLAARKEQYLAELDASLKRPLTESVYICCFCEGDDMLSQWRAYGGNGNGVSIRLDAYEFENYAGEQPYGFLRIWNVFYEEPQQRSLMRDAVERTYQNYKAAAVSEIVRKAKDIIDFFVPTFKHSGFSGEQEWRMIFVPSPASAVKPRYRAARELLIPYFSLKDLVASRNPPSRRKTKKPKNQWRLPILQVCIGPSRHRDLNRGAAQSLLSDGGYDVPVIASHTPYRG
ncbi:MAG: DUF2971 domain-containing protein [Verrucomicrobiota bacterium]|nr:DUF2971 domain-containing protein [Verrucomicrobiota bacterium]